MSPTRNTPYSTHPLNNAEMKEHCEDHSMKEPMECSKSQAYTKPTDSPKETEVCTPTGMPLCNRDIGVDARSCRLSIKTILWGIETNNLLKGQAKQEPSMTLTRTQLPTSFFQTKTGRKHQTHGWS